MAAEAADIDMDIDDGKILVASSVSRMLIQIVKNGDGQEEADEVMEQKVINEGMRRTMLSGLSIAIANACRVQNMEEE